VPKNKIVSCSTSAKSYAALSANLMLD